MVKWLCTKERIDERGPYILIEWSFAKERINETEPYILSFRSWCYSRKRAGGVSPR